MKKCIFIVMLAVILLAVPSFPVKAAAQHIPITGYCLAIGGWEADDFRFWANPNSPTVHWRDIIYLSYCDMDDDRLDGYVLSEDHWNMVWVNGQQQLKAQSFGNGYSSDEFGNQTDFWEFHGTGYYYVDAEDVAHFTADFVWRGKGVNRGLSARTTMTNTNIDGLYYYVGELLVPGH
jgi:hypothetical protein